MGPSYLQQLAHAIRESIPAHLFSKLARGRAACWAPQRVAWIALMMAWDEGQTLGARWRHARGAAREVHPHWKVGDSYSGFARALTRLDASLVPALAERLRRRVREVAGGRWACAGWTAFAVDGTRIEAPHTAANEAGLGCAGRDKAAPQVYLTALWHLGTGLPWAFRVGPGTASERRHMGRMVAELPPRSMLVADAGFPGYSLCRRLIRRHHAFVIRVGGNLTLIEGLGYFHEERDGLVYLRPARHRRWPPLVLRLIRSGAGAEAICLLTNVLAEDRLGDADAPALYRRRWGEEVFFRSYKQTMRRRVLLSRTPETCRAEATWALLGLWLLGLMSVPRIVEAGGEPGDLSVARARDVVRRAMRGGRPPRGRAPRLGRELAASRKDDYRRVNFKGARNCPRKKRERPPGPPKVRAATPAEVKKSARLPPPQISHQWTA